MADDYDKQHGPRVLSNAEIDILVRDAHVPPGIKCLRGVLSVEDPCTGEWRLYLNLDLDTWVDIAPDAVVHVRSSRYSTGDYPLGFSVIWVRSDAQIMLKRVSGGPVSADFLQGQVATLSGTRPAVPSRPAAAMPADDLLEDLSSLLGRYGRSGFSSIFRPC